LNITAYEPEIKDILMTIREARRVFLRKHKDEKQRSTIAQRRYNVLNRSRGKSRKAKVHARPPVPDETGGQGAGTD